MILILEQSNEDKGELDIDLSLVYMYRHLSAFETKDR